MCPVLETRFIVEFMFRITDVQHAYVEMTTDN